MYIIYVTCITLVTNIIDQASSPHFSAYVIATLWSNPGLAIKWLCAGQVSGYCLYSDRYRLVYCSYMRIYIMHHTLLLVHTVTFCGAFGLRVIIRRNNVTFPLFPWDWWKEGAKGIVLTNKTEGKQWCTTCCADTEIGVIWMTGWSKMIYWLNTVKSLT